jgi:hypothetical protein
MGASYAPRRPKEKGPQALRAFSDLADPAIS